MPIQPFKCRDTSELMRDGSNRRFANIAAVALRKLDYLDDLSAAIMHQGATIDAVVRPRAA